jgi:hypothetical protein
MAWTRSILVVANVNATSEELADELKAHAAGRPATFTLVVPAIPIGGGRRAAHSKLTEALSLLRQAELDAEGTVGDSDPLVAVQSVWDPTLHDEIVMCTLPVGTARWLHAALPERVARLTGAPVTHLVCQPAKPTLQASPAPVIPRPAMGPLSVLAWGGPRDLNGDERNGYGLARDGARNSNQQPLTTRERLTRRLGRRSD